MPPYNKYLYHDILINFILYYLITILIFITNIFTALTILISLFRYLFNSSYASVLSKRRIEIVSFIEYDILIVFTNCDIFLIRLIFMFNFSIRSVSNILFDFPYFINMNLFTIFVFFIFILFIVLFFLNYFLLILVLLEILYHRYFYVVYWRFRRVYYLIRSSFFVPK